jgi:hypothetical protein
MGEELANILNRITGGPEAPGFIGKHVFRQEASPMDADFWKGDKRKQIMEAERKRLGLDEKTEAQKELAKFADLNIASLGMVATGTSSSALYMSRIKPGQVVKRGKRATQKALSEALTAKKQTLANLPSGITPEQAPKIMPSLRELNATIKMFQSAVNAFNQGKKFEIRVSTTDKAKEKSAKRSGKAVR